FFLLIFENYYWSYQYLAILMVGLFFSLFSNPYISILNAMAKTNQVLVISIISSVISGISMLLMLYFGAFSVIGAYLPALVVAAYASTWVFTAGLAGLWIKLGVRINLGIRRVMPFIFIAIFMLLSAVLIHFLYLSPLIELAVILVICTLTYMVPIRVFRIVTANEIRKATLLLPKRLAAPIARVLVWIFSGKQKETQNIET
ncbi:MAG: hypothetical protein ACFFCO_08875, partial [Promethearchaeota archaeon]